MRIAARLLAAEMRPRVVHELPGRLRLRLPAVTRVPGAYHTHILSRLESVPLPDGVRELAVELRTGSLLIRYDQDRTSRERVHLWVNQVIDEARMLVMQIMRLPPDRRDAVVDDVVRGLDARIADGVRLGPELLEGSIARKA